jgi:hypothetical protein
MLQLHDMPCRVSPKRDAWEQMKRMGYFRDGRIENPDLSWITDYYKNKPVFVIGSSPALQNMIDEGFDFSLLDNSITIGVNHIIELYDKLSMFVFLDQRFMEKTTYNLKNYKGKIFCRNNTNLFLGDLEAEIYRFMALRTGSTNITNNLNNGIYCDIQSGLCALHIAIVSGANPIYLIGTDTGGTKKEFHIKNYTSEAKTHNTVYTNDIKRNLVYAPFLGYANRIINLDTKGVITHFKKQNWKEIIKKDEKITEIKRIPTVCQVSRFENMTTWNEISRQVFTLTTGNHIRANIINKQLPKADIYILDCVINGANEFINFQKPKGSKVISIVHSSSKCFPALCSDKVIVLSEAERRRLLGRSIDSIVIPCSIDLNNYKYSVDYSKKTYGRITRFTTGKIHPRFYEIVDIIKNKYNDSQCIMITKTGNKIPNINYIENVENDNNDDKAKALSEISVFADYHNTFLETFSLSLLEGMASGCCVVLYSITPQASMLEVLGGSGIVCNSEKEFIDNLIKILPDTEAKKEYGLRARARAREFSVEKMTNSYNKIIEELL